MGKNRFLFYFLISFLVSLVDVLRDLGQESFLDAIDYSAYTFLATFLATTIIYYLRSWIFKNSKVKKFTDLKKSNKWLLYISAILTKSMFFALLVNVIGRIVSPQYSSYSLTGLFFWGSFIAVLCIVLFVYVIEAFLESEAQKREIAIKLSNIENEKIISKYLALKNQLNPHFLFNSFNSLSALISIDKEKAEDFLQKLSDVYRYNLTHSEEIVVPLEKELELARSYMVLQKIRFKEAIEIDYRIDPFKLNQLIPPMTLELLIENAIKHNIVTKNNPLKIKIYTLEADVVVENNYQSRTDSKPDSFGIGLKNLEKQYRLIHNILPVFEVKDDKFLAVIPLIKPSI